MASSSTSKPSPASHPASSGTQRPRLIPHRIASSYDGRPNNSSQSHHRSASSSAMPLPRARIVTRVPRPASPPTPLVSADPRFSRLFSSSLGSPFLKTSDHPLPRLDMEAIDLATQSIDARPPSPTSTADFSIINMDTEDFDNNPFMPGGYHTNNQRFPSSSFARGRGIYATNGNSNWPPNNIRHFPPQSSNSLKTLLPRLWDVLSSPGKTMLNFSPGTNVTSTSPNLSPSSSRNSSPSASPRRHVNQSWYYNAAPNGRSSPVPRHIPSITKNKGKTKAGGFFSSRNINANRAELDGFINYSELPPLDGEEGELIDDEACFIDVKAIRGIDILSLLPPELALHVLTLLSSPPLPIVKVSLNSPVSPGRSSAIINEPNTDSHEALHALLSCRLVSRAWCRLSSDNAVWRALFLGRWSVDLRRAADLNPAQPRNARASLGKTWDYGLVDIGAKAKRVLGLSSPSVVDAPIAYAPLRLDWRILYRERLELDRRWSGILCTPIYNDLDGETTRRIGTMTASNSTRDACLANSGILKTYEPSLMRITGHTDSVYCLEFDSRRIITGSRDRTIKVWSLQTGKLLGTFVGVHRGSVLCLKFERDWDREWNYDTELEENGDGNIPNDRISPTDDTENQNVGQDFLRSGFMVSGSSDCSVCVWDLHLGPIVERDDGESIKQSSGNGEGEREVLASVRAVLKGHVGGVLDLRIDRQWIVSCSKDAVIRVWNRKTLELHRTLRGHEGPVNAVGLQSGKVVSASGDGKMILWDIESGERLRTFEGHDRGLACIEFKDDLIVSGSNDCKIKVWSSSTGDCLRTLVGHEALVRALSFDPRSGRLVSASYDKSVKLWDLGNGKLVREFKGIHTSHIFDVKFDAARIVSTSHDQKTVVLDFSTDLNASLFI